MSQVLQVEGETNPVSEQQVEQNPLREEFEKLLEETLQMRYQQGDIVKGDVVRIERDGVLVDVGAKSEGFVPYKEVSNMPMESIEEVVTLGQEYEFYILREENENADEEQQADLEQVQEQEVL